MLKEEKGLHYGLTDLNELIERMANDYSMVAGKDFKIELALQKGLRQIWMEPRVIEKVVANILMNAKNNLIEEGKISIKTEEQEIDEDYRKKIPGVLLGTFVCITIEDFVSKAQMECMFDEKGNADVFSFINSCKVSSGLSLPGIYYSITKHGGFVFITELEKGNRAYKLYLPVLEKSAQRRQYDN